MRVLVTGGAGFIGSHYTDLRLKKYPRDWVVVLDKLTYAGNPANLKDAKKNTRFKFVKGDICDAKLVDRVVKAHRIDCIVNFAAETHVDRSILSPEDFARTDVLGTQTLLEAVRKYKVKRFLQISTDEVYGSIEKGGFRESDPLQPSSPYSASKAGGDLQVLAYRHTYGLPVIITRSSNNFGPRQYPEKLIPLFVTNAIEGKPLPLYGDGLNMRDWIYVEDNCLGLDHVLEKGNPGEIYNIGAGNTRTNREITRLILKLLNKPQALIKKVPDRPGHDRRYALNMKKTRTLGWNTQWSFREAMAHTVQWYLTNQTWWEPLKSGDYLKYYEKQYMGRQRTKK
ncbi:dTDP-glucose 4,6-dehydratase [bacterium]|nr:dTDP-glucose 4,6-dehydratase [bacterium]